MRAALVLLLLSAGCADVDAVTLGFPEQGVIAHRGLAGHAPEEARLGYEIARDLGVDWLEGDVQRSADGVLVLFHDEDLKLLTDVEDVFPDRKDEGVGAFTFAELQQLDLGTPYNEAHEDKASDVFVGARLMSLDELIDVQFAGAKHLPGLYLETKDPEKFEGIEAEIVALLTSRGLRADLERDERAFRTDTGGVRVGRTRAKVVLQSFDKDSLARFQELAPDLPRTLLFDGDTAVDDAIDAAGDVDAHLAPIGYSSFGWDISAIHAAGKVAHAWTINEGWQLNLVNGFGVDAVFTDFPERALEKAGHGKEDDIKGALRERGVDVD
ncbi:MAG: glycerophosphodiester phosphodiesterase family protein [Deltaproteobacteria bacterium]|nr:glycerophosphodiester phosphodiesterase family protein [Deltaproteobacteria bacterium]